MAGGPDDIEILDVGPAAEPAPEPVPEPRRWWIPVSALAVVALVAGLAVLVLHSPQPHRTPAAASAPPSWARASLPRGAFSCDNPGDCIISSRATPTSSVAAALHQYFPTATDATAQLYLDPASGRVRSQYVIATTPTGIRVTIAISYDGDQFRSGPTYHRDFDRPPTLFFDRHTFEGWSLEVTVGGTTAAQAHRKEGLALLSDPRLLD